MVVWFVCHDFLIGREGRRPCSYRSTCFTIFLQFYFEKISKEPYFVISQPSAFILEQPFFKSMSLKGRGYIIKEEKLLCCICIYIYACFTWLKVKRLVRFVLTQMSRGHELRRQRRLIPPLPSTAAVPPAACRAPSCRCPDQKVVLARCRILCRNHPRLPAPSPPPQPPYYPPAAAKTEPQRRRRRFGYRWTVSCWPVLCRARTCS